MWEVGSGKWENVARYTISLRYRPRRILKQAWQLDKPLSRNPKTDLLTLANWAIVPSMSVFCRLIWYGLIGLFRSRAALEVEILVLRHQLNILRLKSPKRVALNSIDRLVPVGLYRLAPMVVDALKIVRPETLMRWHRAGFREHHAPLQIRFLGPSNRWHESSGGEAPPVNRRLRERSRFAPAILTLVRYRCEQRSKTCQIEYKLLGAPPRMHGRLPDALETPLAFPCAKRRGRCGARWFPRS